MVRVALALILLAACGESRPPKSSMPTLAPPPAVAITPEAAVVDHSVEGKGRAFIAMLVAQNFAGAVATFDATMAAALPEAKLAETWQSILQGSGAFEAVESVRVERVAKYELAIVTCKFAKTKLEVSIPYDQAGKVAGLNFTPPTEPYRDPPYVDRSKFDERDVTVGSGEWALPGTLALPKGMGPFRAVVLVHGSGPNDRDESVGANKPFKDLSGALASRGIAVVRYDKRTKVHPGKLAKLTDATIDHEIVDDAIAAVELLRTIKEIDQAHIVVVGHSLGGFAAPRIGAKSKHIAGLAILAGSTRPIPDMMLEQMEYMASLDPNAATALASTIAEVKTAQARIKELQAGGAVKPGEFILGGQAAYWSDIGRYDVLAVAKKYAKPMFIAQGGRDYQVTLVDFEAFKKALAKRKNVTFKLYAELNHLFGAGIGKSSPAEYQQRVAVDQRLVDDLAAWVGALK
ncbi:MAG: alpha/beta fold hydrolase [Deltaproteobacteria bacterium]|nr:alpha/beta fold hydrolase [Deltaproteobacteria bacterium]MDQ3295586.1 alpha/beta fold hydrolase [Myxococcota bacterium]